MAGRVFSLAVAMSSMATIALELVLTRIYSVTMYYHFAFLAISVALLGLAAAGTTIFLLPRTFTRERTPRQAAGFMVLFAVSVFWALWAAVDNPISLTDWSANLGKLAHVYVAAAAPLVCSGFAISLAISSAGDQIGRIYMFDLVGAGLGCVFVIPAIGWFGAPGAVFVVGALGACAALLFAASDRKWAHWRIVAGIATVAMVVLVGLGVTESSSRRLGIVRNPSKFLGNREVLFEKWNSFSQITLAPSADKDHRWIFIDGDAATRMWTPAAVAGKDDLRKRIAEVRVAAMVYAMRTAGPAAIIGPGGGSDVLSALRAGVPRVVGIEINPIIVDDVMRDTFAGENGDLYRDPRVEVIVDEGRSYLRRVDEKFSSIQATLVDTWAASSSGAFTLSENNLYTVEAFEEFFDALAPNGVVSVTRWYDRGKPAEFVRLLAIARRALEQRGVSSAEIRDHVLIADDTQLRTTLMVSRDRFSDADRTKFASLVASERVHSLYTAGGSTNDKLLASVLETADLDALLATFTYDASPTTDNQPFFFYHLRFGDVLSSFGKTKGQLNNVGIVILILLLGFSLVTTLLFIVVPLVAFRRKDLAVDRGRKLRVIAYFACLGFGFILVELGFMQQFVLFLGHPVYSLGVVLSGLLIASGIGAGLTPRIVRRWGVPRARKYVVVVLSVVLVIYGLVLSPMFGALIGLALPIRIVISLVFVMVPGLLMGTFVPGGVRAAEAVSPGLVAWGWGINGATSVIGSVVAVMVSMTSGFRVALWIGVAFYIVAGLVLPRLEELASRDKA